MVLLFGCLIAKQLRQQGPGLAGEGIASGEAALGGREGDSTTVVWDALLPRGEGKLKLCFQRH